MCNGRVCPVGQGGWCPTGQGKGSMYNGSGCSVGQVWGSGCPVGQV